MQTKKDDPAFPDEYYYGLSKREYFAAAALQGLLASPKNLPINAEFIAVIMADRLIEVLNRSDSKCAVEDQEDKILD